MRGGVKTSWLAVYGSYSISQLTKSCFNLLKSYARSNCRPDFRQAELGAGLVEFRIWIIRMLAFNANGKLCAIGINSALMC